MQVAMHCLQCFSSDFFYLFICLIAIVHEVYTSQLTDLEITRSKCLHTELALSPTQAMSPFTEFHLH